MIDSTTRQVIAFGYLPTPPTDPHLLVVEITDAQAAKLTQPGIKTLGANGQIAVAPPDAPVPDPQVAKRAAAIAALKGAASGNGAMATVAQAILDMGNVS